VRFRQPRRRIRRLTGRVAVAAYVRRCAARQRRLGLRQPALPPIAKD
jgi:hypothetical protein